MSNNIQQNLNENLKKTSLFFNHTKLNAKMVPFAGWSMPVQYSAGLIAEHNAVRTSVGIFDVSHMGEIEVLGNESTLFLQELTVNNVGAMQNGQAQYNAICNDDGKLLDDIIIYKKSDQNYFVCVNASNTEKDFSWFQSHAQKYDIELRNISNQIGQLAIQGPNSRKLLSKILDKQIETLEYYHFFETQIFDQTCLVARTGYTGELGYEIYCPSQITSKIWEQVLDVGKEFNILPCGLGARDILRLEVGYPLYGNDMDETTTPLESGLKWIVKFNKDNFIGKNALIQQLENGVDQVLAGFEMCDRAIGRHGYPVYNPQNQEEQIGVVTSGSPSPSLAKNIGFVRVKNQFSKLNTDVLVSIRGSLKPAKIVKKSFYTNGTVLL